MFEKTKIKLSESIKKQYNETLGAVSKGTLQIALQKDVGSFAWSNRKAIKKYYDLLFGNYIQILKYMKRDFHVKKYENNKINDEISNCELHFKRYGGNMGALKRIVAVGGVKPLIINLERLKAVNDLLEEYPKLLKEFQKYIKEGYHKTIDIKDQYILLDEAAFLKNDGISLLLEAAKKDLKQNGHN